ncbi:hypothetical protein [Streptomyces sp. NPDC127098]|uniref:phosphotriesterase family protein n=1 Tax=Streptomyces sp. NPDC127098 TaxID=3347137 RepID=UPI00364ACA82
MVQSVTGPLLPEQLGVTLPHEHVFDCLMTCHVGGDLIAHQIDRRLSYLRTVIEKGYQNQILLSQDVCQRSHPRALGGPGYTFLFDEFRALATEAGIDPEVLDLIHTTNPRRAIFGQ